MSLGMGSGTVVSEVWGRNILEGKAYEAYAHVLQAEGILYPDGAFPERVRKDPLLFEYGGTLSLESFKREYSSNNWLGRKVTALPLVAFSVMKVALHLFKAMVEPFMVACNSEERAKIRKNEIFACAQDFKEAFGRIVTLFDDARGSLLVQQALFQKSYYDFACKKSYQASFEPNTSMREDAEKISLVDLKHMDEETRKGIVHTFELDPFIQTFSCMEGGFWKVLEDADEGMLRLFTIWDIKRDRHPCFLQKEYFEIPIFLRKKEDLLGISMKEVYLFQEDDFSSAHMQVLEKLRERLLMVDDREIGDMGSLQNVSEMTFAAFLHTPSALVNQHIEEIPAWVFRYFPAGQEREIELSRLSKDQMLGFLSTWEEEAKDRVRLIPKTWIEAHKGALGPRYERLLKDRKDSVPDSGDYGDL